MYKTLDLPAQDLLDPWQTQQIETIGDVPDAQVLELEYILEIVFLIGTDVRHERSFGFFDIVAIRQHQIHNALLYLLWVDLLKLLFMLLHLHILILQVAHEAQLVFF